MNVTGGLGYDVRHRELDPRESARVHAIVEPQPERVPRTRRVDRNRAHLEQHGFVARRGLGGRRGDAGGRAREGPARDPGRRSEPDGIDSDRVSEVGDDRCCGRPTRADDCRRPAAAQKPRGSSVLVVLGLEVTPN